MSYFSQEFNNFFIELSANNNKEWFHLNKNRYETEVKNPFQTFVIDLIAEVNKYKPLSLEPKKAIFRINNDIRFSKLKTPYKTHVGAIIATNGTKNNNGDGLYIHLSPGECYIGGGLYQLEKNDLYKIRNYITNNLVEFNTLLNDKNFRKYFDGFATSEVNKIIPKEFIESAIKQPLIYNKQFYFMKVFDDGNTFLKDNQLLESTINYFKALIPWQAFFLKALSQTP